MSITGLLLMSSSGARLGPRSKLCLSAASALLSDTLYVHRHPCPASLLPSLSRFTTQIYSTASAACPALDVRLLIKQAPDESPPKFDTLAKAIDWILVEPGFPRTEVDRFITEYFKERMSSGGVRVQFIENHGESGPPEVVGQAEEEVQSERTYDVVVIGGTFDRIHNGHRALLMEAVLRCRTELIVGVTDESMLKKKSLNELIEPVDVRIAKVQEFLQDVAPSLTHRVLPISDPYGPTITEDNIQLIVVSPETVGGADKINEIRKERNFRPLLVHSIPLFPELAKQSQHEEEKISSSSMRLRILGDRLRRPLKPLSLPYVIGLTGGIASGKSNICKHLRESLQVPTVDCDLLGHEAYRAGTPVFDQIVRTFGPDVVSPADSEADLRINRRALGSKVFGRPEELKKLTDIVWPEIKRLAWDRISALSAQGQKVIVVDAAVLLEAGWDEMCHEVWVTFIPREEAVRRVQERDGLSQAEAESRIDSQLTNQERVRRATFAFSSLWEPQFTRGQVTKAYAQIKSLLETL